MLDAAHYYEGVRVTSAQPVGQDVRLGVIGSSIAMAIGVVLLGTQGSVAARFGPQSGASLMSRRILC